MGCVVGLRVVGKKLGDFVGIDVVGGAVGLSKQTKIHFQASDFRLLNAAKDESVLL